MRECPPRVGRPIGRVPPMPAADRGRRRQPYSPYRADTAGGRARRPGHRRDHQPARAPQRGGQRLRRPAAGGLRGLRRRRGAVGGHPHRGRGHLLRRRRPQGGGRGRPPPHPRSGPGTDGPDPAHPVQAGHRRRRGLRRGRRDELALWCDLRVAAEDAIFGVFCRRFGVPLCDLGTVRLPRIIGHGRAMDLILTGRAVAAPRRHHRAGQPGGGPRRALAGRGALAHQLAALPQFCLRSDRMSALEQWGLTEEEAAVNEARRGRAIIEQRRDPRGCAALRRRSRRGGCDRRLSRSARPSVCTGRGDGGRLRLRRHPDRRRQRLPLLGRAPRPLGGVAGHRRASSPHCSAAALFGGTGGRRRQGAPVHPAARRSPARAT